MNNYLVDHFFEGKVDHFFEGFGSEKRGYQIFRIDCYEFFYKEYFL